MSYQKFPHSITPLDETLNDYIKEVFVGEADGFVEVGSKKYFQKGKYARFAEIIYNFEVRPDDVWIVTFPRSGTTLTQEMIWLIANNDYQTAENVPLLKRFPFLEFATYVPDNLIEKIRSEIGDDKEKMARFEDLIVPEWELLKDAPSRRFIKSHLPLSLLPPTLLTSGCKVIYVARNPKDVAVSCFIQHSTLRLRHFVKDLQTYWNIFENNLVSPTPYWEHVIEGWERRQDKNVLFMFYEDTVRDYRSAVKKLSDFLEKPMTDEQVEKLANYVHFDNFRKQKSVTVNYAEFFGVGGKFKFVRKGKVGGWKEYFTQELNDRANKWIDKHYKKTDLRFPIGLD